MDIPGKRICCWLLALAALSCVAARASAQSLSLTYSLRGAAESVQQAALAANPCGGLKWLTSLEACGRDLLARFAPAARSLQAVTLDSAESNAASPAPNGLSSSAPARGASPASVAAVFPFDLPTLGGSAAPSGTHARGAKDASGGSTREPDVTLKVGSTYRSRGGEDANWEAHRFTDMKYETHKQNRGHKTVGIELLVPFQ